MDTDTERAKAGYGGTVDMFGIPISNIDLAGACDRIEARIKHRTPGYVVTTNVNHVCLCHRDEVFRGAYENAFLALADGVPLIWASWLLGRPLRKKLSGSDLVPWLSKFAAEKNFSIFLLGGTPGTADETAKILQKRHPNLKIAGVHCPPYGFEKDPEEQAKIMEILHAAKPDLLFVALGSPKQELWMRENYQAIDVPVSIGVGATFDFISGRIRRAPALVQQLGFEWGWRLAMEPRRLWRRYLVEDTLFFRLLWQEFRKGRRATAPHSEQ